MNCFNRLSLNRMTPDKQNNESSVRCKLWEHSVEYKNQGNKVV